MRVSEIMIIVCVIFTIIVCFYQIHTKEVKCERNGGILLLGNMEYVCVDKIAIKYRD